MARVTSDTDRIAELVTWGLLDVTWGVMNTVTAMFFMLSINGRLALIVLAIIPVLLVVAVQFRKRILVQFRQVRKANSKITGAYNENITGVRVVKALCREEENLREFGELTGDDVPRLLPRRLALGPLPAGGADHQPPLPWAASSGTAGSRPRLAA